jgi:ammonia channel protein AmtB
MVFFLKTKSVYDDFVKCGHVRHGYSGAIGKLCIGPKNSSCATVSEQSRSSDNISDEFRRLPVRISAATPVFLTTIIRGFLLAR